MDEASNLRDPRDPRTLLCERCGYVLEGLPASGPCPECAEPIEASLPARRVGSAWQQAPGVRGWWKTTWALLVRPRSTMRVLSVAGSVGWWYAGVNAALVAIVLSVPWFVTASEARERHPRTVEHDTHWLESLSGIDLGVLSNRESGTVLALLAMIAIFLLILTAVVVEAWGSRLFARHRRWRGSQRLSTTICIHASAGWLLVVCLCAWVSALQFLYLLIADGWSGTWPPSLTEEFMSIVALFFGFLYFEWLAFIGMRARKYANAPRDNAAP